jgi:sugar lactone lactonase YvrE
VNDRLLTRAAFAAGLALVVAGCGSTGSAAGGTAVPSIASASIPSHPVSSARATSLAPTGSVTPATTGPIESAAGAAPAIVVPLQTPEPLPKRLWSTSLTTPKAGANSAIATAPDGRVWVVSALDGQIAVLDPNGRPVKTIGALGASPGMFDFTDAKGNVYGGVAFDRVGNAVVADTFNHRVQVLDASGKVSGGWGSFGTDDGQFVQPVGIALDDRGHVFVGDGSRNDIQEFASDGKFIRVYSDSIDYTHSQASQVAVDAGHAIYTTIGMTVVKIDPSGTVAATFDLSAYGFPDAVVVDKTGNLWIPTVSTSGNSAVSRPLVVLDPAGKVLHVWDLNGNLVSLDPKEDAIYVTSFQSADIAKYGLPAR